MEIYSDYDKEPDDIFFPLTEKLYCELYALEMDTFSDDIVFYKKNIPQNSSLLEIGSGTGRISRALADKNRPVIGIDISRHMLDRATIEKNPTCRYICMDMRQLAFSISFDTILIPYNTLNLLSQKDDILSCLNGCRSLLTKDGKIYLQLFVPDKSLTTGGRRMFHFQIFDKPEGGRIIKEILKKYSAESQTVSIEERYRLRPIGPEEDKHDLNHFFTISGFSYNQWLSLFKQAGLTVVRSWGDYDMSPFNPHNSSCLLAVLRPL